MECSIGSFIGTCQYKMEILGTFTAPTKSCSWLRMELGSRFGGVPMSPTTPGYSQFNGKKAHYIAPENGKKIKVLCDLSGGGFTKILHYKNTYGYKPTSGAVNTDDLTNQFYDLQSSTFAKLSDSMINSILQVPTHADEIEVKFCGRPEQGEMLWYKCLHFKIPGRSFRFDDLAPGHGFVNYPGVISAGIRGNPNKDIKYTDTISGVKYLDTLTWGGGPGTGAGAGITGDDYDRYFTEHHSNKCWALREIISDNRCWSTKHGETLTQFEIWIK